MADRYGGRERALVTKNKTYSELRNERKAALRQVRRVYKAWMKDANFLGRRIDSYLNAKRILDGDSAENIALNYTHMTRNQSTLEAAIADYMTVVTS